MSQPIDTAGLDNCGCCEPDPAIPEIYNRPGLPALAYRAGTYATIFRKMLRRLGTFTLQDGDFAGTRPLAALTTRENDDPSVALLDASAVVADVLTFYQERIANEGFLRTAVERRSILEMARSIGYELNPGVAATVYLAFTVEDAQSAPGVSEIPSGMKIQSIPPQGKNLQTFETAEALTAYKEWNALRPRLSHPQGVGVGSQQVYLTGLTTNLKTGDRVLLVAGTGSGQQLLARVHKVTLDTKAGVTRVDLASAPATSVPLSPATTPGHIDITQKFALSEDNVQTWIAQKSWADQDLNAFLTFNEWDRTELLGVLADMRARNLASTGELHALRASSGFFGNSAPRYATLPTATNPTTGADFGTPWDNGWEIWKDHSTETYFDPAADAYLERSLPNLVPDGWVVLGIPGGTRAYFKLTAIEERSLTGFAISGKALGLKLSTPAGAALVNADKSSAFTVRATNAHLQSEQLALAELAVTDDLAAGTDTLELDGLALGLHAGQSVTLTGERTDSPGLTGSEVLTITEITHAGGFTTLKFDAGWGFAYSRGSVTLNANTVRATHGETVSEILGSGDGAQLNQRFTLKKPPLTFTPASTPSGSASTLQLRVDNLLWKQAPSLYRLGSNDRDYIIRLDEDAKAALVFGDGDKGARLPTGQNNVTAVYRTGIGLDGEVDAGALTLLPSKPFGVRSVTNPLPASGAGDPEKMGGARENAPLTVRTLDRIVSREDYEDFARAFAGIGKAQAIDLWSGQHHLVHVTLGGDDGEPITSTDFIRNFIAALERARDPAQLVRVDTFDLLLFDLSASVAVDAQYIVDDVFAAVQSALARAFAFERRGFGQHVTAAEVITVIQDVPGVVFVDLDALYLSSGTAALNQILVAGIAHAEGPAGAIKQAQLLLLNTLGVSLQEVKA